MPSNSVNPRSTFSIIPMWRCCICPRIAQRLSSRPSFADCRNGLTNPLAGANRSYFVTRTVSPGVRRAHDDVRVRRDLPRPALAGVWQKVLIAKSPGIGYCLSTGLFDQRDYLASIRFFGRKIVDCNVGSLPRVSDCRRSAHTGVTSGDKHLRDPNDRKTADEHLRTISLRLLGAIRGKSVKSLTPFQSD